MWWWRLFKLTVLRSTSLQRPFKHLSYNLGCYHTDLNIASHRDLTIVFSFKLLWLEWITFLKLLILTFDCPNPTAVLFLSRYSMRPVFFVSTPFVCIDVLQNDSLCPKSTWILLDWITSKSFRQPLSKERQ